jgi:small subunit ribosomal protein S1
VVKQKQMDLDKNGEQSQETSPAPTNADKDATHSEFLELLEESFDYKPPRRGEIRKAIIMQIDRNEIIVDMGAKQDGIVTSQDIERLDPSVRDSLKVGQEVPVYVLQPRDSDGNLIVSINMGLQQFDWEEATRLMANDQVVEVEVIGHNRGGVLVRWNRLEGFIPSSHMVTVSAGLQGTERRDALESLRDRRKMLAVKVIEVNPDRRRLIFSEREAQREWRAQQKARLLAELKEGDVVPGTVTGLRDFGAFVNLGGADGLIHVSELAWHRVDHPRDVLNVGDVIDVFILSLDRATNRIALSRKRLLPDPWDNAIDRYYEGQLVEGIVTNVVDFGAFIALDDGLEGLLHLSEMGDGSLKEPHSYVKKGDRLQLRISRLEPERRRVGFTQRWGTEIQEAEVKEVDADQTPPPAEPSAQITEGEQLEATPAELPMQVMEESAPEMPPGELPMQAVEESTPEAPPTDLSAQVTEGELPKAPPAEPPMQVMEESAPEAPPTEDETRTDENAAGNEVETEE